MSNYPDVEDTIALLLTAARDAAKSQRLQHPEDVAGAMITAIEFSSPVILESYRRFSKK